MRRTVLLLIPTLGAAAAGLWIWRQPSLPAWLWLPPILSCVTATAFALADRHGTARSRLGRWALFCVSALGVLAGIAGVFAAIARNTLFPLILSLPLEIDPAYHFNLAAGPVWLPGFAALAATAALARGSVSWPVWDESLYEQWRRRRERNRPAAREGKADLVIGTDADTKQPIVLPEESRTMHMLVSGPTGSGKCIRGDSLVPTDRGVVEIASLAAERTPETSVPMRRVVRGVNGPEETEGWYYDGRRPTIRVTTRYGFQIEGTPDHKILVAARDGSCQWRRLGEIKVGDYVALARGASVWPSDPVPVLPVEYHRGARRLALPETVNEDFAELMGWLTADGCLTNPEVVTFTKNDPDALNRVVELLKRIGAKPRVRIQPGRASEVHAFSKPLREVFASLGMPLTTAKDKRVPQCILSSPRHIVAAFLRGLFSGDASVNPARGIEFVTASKEMARQVQALLLAFGIPAALRPKEVKGYGTYWRLLISGDAARVFNEEIGFALPSKQAKLDRLAARAGNTNVDLIPFAAGLLRAIHVEYRRRFRSFPPRYRRMWSSYVYGLRRPSYAFLQAVLIAYARVADTVAYKMLAGLARHRPFFDPVKLIEEGEAEVFDFTVPNSHSFVANGFFNHNTMGVLHPCVAQDIANPNAGVTVIEPKGDWIGLEDRFIPEGAVPGVLALAERYGRKVYLVDPTRENTDVVNPLAGDLGPVLETNVAMFNALFGAQQAFFAHVEATVLKNFIRLLKYLRGDNVTYLDLMGLLRNPEQVLSLVGELAALLKVEYSPPEIRDGQFKESGALGKLSPETDHRHELLQWFVYDYFHRSSAAQWREHSLGLRTLFDKLFSNPNFLRCVIPRQGARAVDFDRHLEERSVLLVPTNDGVLGELSQVLGVLVAMSLQFAVSRRGSYEFIRSGRARPLHVLYMDEFSTYVTKEFVGFIEKARGMNCAVVLGFQSIGQLEKAGAQIGIGRAFRNVIVDQCGTKIVYGRLGPDDVEFWARLFGTSRRKEESRSEMHRRDAAQLVPDSVSISTTVRETETEHLSYNDIRFQEENRFVYELLVGRTLQRARRGIARALHPEDVPPKGSGRPWTAGIPTPATQQETQAGEPALPEYLSLLQLRGGKTRKGVADNAEEEAPRDGGGARGRPRGGRERAGDDDGNEGRRARRHAGGENGEAERAALHEEEDWDAQVQALRED